MRGRGLEETFGARIRRDKGIQILHPVEQGEPSITVFWFATGMEKMERAKAT